MGSGSFAQKRSTPKIDRRKTIREIIFTRFPVLVLTDEMHKNAEEPVEGLLTDLGKGGVGIITSIYIPNGSRVRIVLQSKPEFDRELAMTAIWSNPLPSAHRILKSGKLFWRNGLHFSVDAAQEQKDFIVALFNALQK